MWYAELVGEKGWEIFHGEAGVGRSVGHGGSGPPGLLHPSLVPEPGGTSGDIRERMDERGAPAGTEPWDPSINNVPHPFSQGGCLLYGQERGVSGANLIW